MALRAEAVEVRVKALDRVAAGLPGLDSDRASAKLSHPGIASGICPVQYPSETNFVS
jgi:hypothetical protein